MKVGETDVSLQAFENRKIKEGYVIQIIELLLTANLKQGFLFKTF